MKKSIAFEIALRLARDIQAGKRKTSIVTSPKQEKPIIRPKAKPMVQQTAMKDHPATLAPAIVATKPLAVNQTLFAVEGKPKQVTLCKDIIRKQVSTALPLTPRQMAALGSRDRLVIQHLPLVKGIAVRLHENLPIHMELDDLAHAGVLGLFDAAEKFKPQKKVPFSSYAKHRIKGAMLDSLRQLDWASRDMRRRQKVVELAARELSSVLKRPPNEQELAQKLGMEIGRLRNMMLDLRNVGLISNSTRSANYEDLPAPDFPDKPSHQPDEICAHNQIKEFLGEAMRKLPKRYQKVVVLYYREEWTMKEIGLELGIHESRVSQIHKMALEKMSVVLAGKGVNSSQAFKNID